MLLKSFARAQRQIARRKGRNGGLGRARDVCGDARESHLASLQLDELLSLSLSCLSGSEHAKASVRFGVMVEEIVAFEKALRTHVGAGVAEACKALHRCDHLKLEERKAGRKLFNAIAGSVQPTCEDKKADFRVFLKAIKGLDSPGLWTWEAKAAVFRILGRARAGVGRVHDRPVVGEVGGRPLREITWGPTLEGADINRFWVAVVTLALLRARALFLFEHQRQSAANRRTPSEPGSGDATCVSGPGR